MFTLFKGNEGKKSSLVPKPDSSHKIGNTSEINFKYITHGN
jgi:hypothetical protein